jgi:colanic acid/amylovoran biosynthesis glycosyltransferase
VSDSRNVWIYRRELLPPSEVFIPRQASALCRYQPVWCGNRRVPGLSLPSERTFVAGASGRVGRLEQQLHLATRRSLRLERGVRALPPALFHAHFGPDGLDALPLARRAGVPLAVTFHGYDASLHDRDMRARGYSQKRYARHRLDLADAGVLCLAVSEFVRQRLIDQGFPPSRVTVHYIGVEVPEAQPRELPRVPHILFVGRFAGKKGLPQLIQAMGRCREHVPNARLTIVGDGPLRPIAERAAKDLGDVELTGWLPNAAVAELMSASTAVCLPSVTGPDGDTEGLPTVAVEAAARGVPTVGFRHAGIPELVEHEVTGLLADEGDAAVLGDQLARVCSDPALGELLGAAARRRVEESFDLRQQTALLEELYDREIAGR